jgi:hypothetical protein
MHEQSNIINFATSPNTTLISNNNNSQQFDPKILLLIEEFSKWRANKKKSAEPIPNQLWEKIFALEEIYSSAQLRRIFNISIGQYHKKFAELRPFVDTATTKETQTPVPQLCQVTIKRNPYEQAPLPSAKTLVVEFCRSDGRIMKIHTTQDSIPTLMNTFFAE